MFKRYYPKEEDDAISDIFAKDLMAKLEERSEGVASCGLQHFFVVNRKNNASEALARINMIFEEIDSRKAEKEDLEKDAEKEKKKAKNEEDSDDEDDDEKRRPKKRGGRDEDANKDVSSGYSVENLTRLSLLTVQVALVTTCAMVVSSALKSLPKSR